MGFLYINALCKEKGRYQSITRNGISFGSIMIRVLMKLVLIILLSFYESQFLITQFDFPFAKGCNDGMYVNKQIKGIAYFSNKNRISAMSTLQDHMH